MRSGWPAVDLTEPVALLGGEDSEVWRCGDHVVRVHPTDAPAREVGWCQDWAVGTAALVPEVVVALPDVTGTRLRACGGQQAEVQPYVDGIEPDPTDPVIVRAVANLLVRMAAASRELDLRGRLGERPGWSGAPWDEPRWAAASGLVDHELDRWYDGFAAATDHERLALHADLHEGNLLQRGDRIVAVLDPDDARVLHPLAELSFAAWELARPVGDWRLDATALQSFLDAYGAAAGAAVDRSTVLRLMRVQLRWAVGHHLTDDPQPEVAAMQAASFGQIAALESGLTP